MQRGLPHPSKWRKKSGSFPYPDTPRLFVYFLREYLPRIRKCRYLLHMIAEITNLVESVPRGHLDRHPTGHIRNSHGYVKKMLFRMGQRHFITDGCVAGRAEYEKD